jgi:hypothetical protein
MAAIDKEPLLDAVRDLDGSGERATAERVMDKLGPIDEQGQMFEVATVSAELEALATNGELQSHGKPSSEGPQGSSSETEPSTLWYTLPAS